MTKLVCVKGGGYLLYNRKFKPFHKSFGKGKIISVSDEVGSISPVGFRDSVSCREISNGCYIEESVLNQGFRPFRKKHLQVEEFRSLEDLNSFVATLNPEQFKFMVSNGGKYLLTFTNLEDER